MNIGFVISGLGILFGVIALLLLSNALIGIIIIVVSVMVGSFLAKSKSGGGI